MFRSLALGIVILFLMGCSGPPSEADAKTVLAAKVNQESTGLIQLVDFKKTNAIEQEVMGRKLYKLEYSAEIEFTDDIMWSGPGPFGWDGRFQATKGRPRGGLDAFHPAFMGKTPGDKGKKFKVTGAVVFEKAEKGWRPIS
ncbi:MAG: hypothetical protein J0L57_15795 [Burkholderiales bacterium]|nr:hypothetical protein [Burkholderiales bacterium]